MGGGGGEAPALPARTPVEPQVDLAALAKQRRELDAKRRGASSFRVDPISTGLAIGSNSATPSSGTGIAIP